MRLVAILPGPPQCTLGCIERARRAPGLLDPALSFAGFLPRRPRQTDRIPAPPIPLPIPGSPAPPCLDFGRLPFRRCGFPPEKINQPAARRGRDLHLAISKTRSAVFRGWQVHPVYLSAHDSRVQPPLVYQMNTNEPG